MKEMRAHAKVAAIFLGVLLFRLIPWRAPNVEPILASVMPLSKRGGALQAALFAVLSIVVYDALTAGWGVWTLVPALTYGLIGAASHVYFARAEASRAHFVGFSVAAILFYDAVTALIGPAFEGQSLAVALAGQVPFTALHLLGGVVFAALVSPALYRWLSTETVPALAPAQLEA